MDHHLSRSLYDQKYERRKSAALELEKQLKEFLFKNETNKIKLIIDQLASSFNKENHSNIKNGGLIGLAAAAVALDDQLIHYLDIIIKPILSCFNDIDPRIRYFTCESMYNIAKVSRSNLLPHFDQIFDCLNKLSSDSELSVKNGSELLDRLIKDIVTESYSQFNLNHFIQLLSKRIYVVSPFTRMFLLSWISLFDSINSNDLISHLPKILDALLRYLSDSSPDVRSATQSLLNNFLSNIQSNQSQPNYFELAETLFNHLNSQDEVIQFSAIHWLSSLFDSAPSLLIPLTPRLIPTILPYLSHHNPHTQHLVDQLNSKLFNIIKGSLHSIENFDYQLTLSNLTLQLLNDNVQTRVAALDWMLMLQSISPQEIFSLDDATFPALLKTLSDPSEHVIKRNLRLLAQISKVSDFSYFIAFMKNLIQLFSTDRGFLDLRGSLIIRQLSLSLGSSKIYQALADIIQSEDDFDFVSFLIQKLTIVLITAPELSDLRKSLKNIETDQDKSLFCKIYKSWSHNPISVFTLCLLSQNYQHASELLYIISDLHVNVDLLVQVDKLVQLIESPVFIGLRLQLLEPDQNPFLFKCLYGLLMILPQSSAFMTLKNRLNAVDSQSKSLYNKNTETVLKENNLPWNDLKDHFKSTQLCHEQAKLNQSHESQTIASNTERMSLYSHSTQLEENDLIDNKSSNSQRNSLINSDLPKTESSSDPSVSRSPSICSVKSRFGITPSKKMSYKRGSMSNTSGTITPFANTPSPSAATTTYEFANANIPSYDHTKEQDQFNNSTRTSLRRLSSASLNYNN
ncbi:hypothetical protein E3P81_03381 [Wallemia ichthyophaga]|nr:hypothetical protein E3P97_03418 [Wallemia ichthyophaga]TIB44771.1 hypothetical protein E3P82_03386 [Wallemia ichthyophaga]TIB47126.1 hypothetical protein E3P81_03381 [Wallemia ichthyophaga]TIB50155.1 hypothetical protein E3P80_03390 [Wallemia ichthyophaga]TIB56650.1 hypothetical protein E3P79_03383 [Wallemia ichthyophaga]